MKNDINQNHQSVSFSAFLKQTEESLRQHFQEVDTWFLEEDIRSYKPKNGGWSINEILEHISLTNHFLLILINKAAEKARKKPYVGDVIVFHYDQDTLTKLNEIGQHGAFDWIRPEHMEPTNEVPLHEVKNTLYQQFQHCLSLLYELKDGQGLNTQTQMSVNGIGKIDVYQYIYFLSLHVKRHVSQMEKNKQEYLAH